MAIYTLADASTNVVGTTETIQANNQLGTTDFDGGITSFYTNNFGASLSTALRSYLQRADSSTGGTPTGQTPEQTNTRSAAPNLTGTVAWTSAPSLLGNPIVVFTHTSSSSALMRFWHVPNFRYPIRLGSQGIGAGSNEWLSVVTSAGAAQSFITNPIWREDAFGRDYAGGRRIAKRGRDSGYQNFYSSGHARLTGSGGSACGTNQCIQAFNPIQSLDWQDTSPQWNIQLFSGGPTTFPCNLSCAVTTGYSASSAATFKGSLSLGVTGGFTTSGKLTLTGSVNLPVLTGFTASGKATFAGAITLPITMSISIDSGAVTGVKVVIDNKIIHLNKLSTLSKL